MPDASSSPALTSGAASSMPSMADLFPEWSERSAAPVPSDPLRNETVLVTGAGGSLGTALTHRLLESPARRLVLLDTSEHGLVRLRHRVDAIDATRRPPVDCILGDLRLPADRHRALRTEPTVVLHAAAYKHVPFLADRPIAATQNNLLATADWLAACRDAGSVERFVFVSTDKAVAADGVMGATKAVAERLLRCVRAAPSGLTATTVRLGNVFGSRGSVVPRFCRRLRNERPLPVTHPAMERWFLSPAAAARSVVRALDRPAGTFIPTICRSVSILRLARRLVRWHRPAAAPDDWIRIVGPRDGERLREHLLGPDEQRIPGSDDPLAQIRAPAPPARPPLQTALDRLRRHCQSGNPAAVRSVLLDAARGVTQPTGPTGDGAPPS